MRSDLTNPNSLRNDQYKDSSNLSARAELHQRFSTNSTSWQQWVFDQIEFPENGRILEVGSGPGYLWQENNKRPPNHLICLSDISRGMLEESRAALTTDHRLLYTVHDVCNIPFPERFFDAVIANHMLYHVTDISAALREIKRVLKPGGCLYAATNGTAHLQEIKAWKTQFFHDQEFPDWGTAVFGFNFENGAELLGEEFANVHFSEYPDRLLVDQVDPIIRYIQSYTHLDESDPRTIQFRDFLQLQITENGSIKITKESGIFTAAKR